MRIAIATCAAATLLAGCTSTGSDPGLMPVESAATSTSRPTTTPATERPRADEVVDIAIEDGRVTPQGGRVEMAVGDTVVLDITSDADEAIHVHSDPEQTFDVGAGEAVTGTFTVDVPGQVAIEAHHLGVTIVQLVVRP